MHIPSESLFSLLTDVRTARPPPSNIPDFPQLNWGDVLEIQGPSGSGKTQLLYSFLALCIMPSPHGWGKAAVLFDTEGTFDALNFRRVLLRAFSKSNMSADVQRATTTCLGNLHVFFPASSAQLAASIAHLPAYHMQSHADIGIVAVDTLSGFYWPDRFTAEQLRSIALANNTTSLHHVFSALQAFRASHRPVTILTNWGLTAEKSNQSPPIFYKQHLSSYPCFSATRSEGSHNDVPHNTSLPLTHHVTLNPTPTSFPPIYCGPSLPKEGGDGREVVGYIRRPGCSVGKFLVDIRV